MRFSILLWVLLLVVPFSGKTQVIDSSLIKMKAFVYFDTGSHEIDSNGIKTLVAVLDSLSKNKGNQLITKGHTDKVGNPLANLKLSQLRVESINHYFISKGIDNERIKSGYYGEERLLENSADEANRNNRRVELILEGNIELRKFNGTVYDDSLNAIANVRVMSQHPEFSDTIQTDENGVFELHAPEGEKVNLVIEDERIFYQSKQIKVSRALDKFPLKLKSKRIVEGLKYSIENLLFYGDSPTPLPQSKKTLEQLCKTLKISRYCCHIIGHINRPNLPPIGKETKHYKLSIARSLTVKNYLESKGIESWRLSNEGKGNSEMKYPDFPTTEQQKQNRRVEIELKKCKKSSTVD